MELISINQINQYLEKIPGWSLEDNGKSIIRVFEFGDFLKAMEFINRIAGIAEQEGHHPDMKIYDYNKVEVLLTTHSLGGLTEKDFNTALKVDKI